MLKKPFCAGIAFSLLFFSAQTPTAAEDLPIHEILYTIDWDSLPSGRGQAATLRAIAFAAKRWAPCAKWSYAGPQPVGFSNGRVRLDSFIAFKPLGPIGKAAMTIARSKNGAPDAFGIFLDPAFLDSFSSAERIAAHEMGHAMGLPHSPYRRSAMNDDSTDGTRAEPGREVLESDIADCKAMISKSAAAGSWMLSRSAPAPWADSAALTLNPWH